MYKVMFNIFMFVDYVPACTLLQLQKSTVTRQK